MSNLKNMALTKTRSLMFYKKEFAASSILAGMCIGFGVMISFTVGSIAATNHNPYATMLMGISFCVALTTSILLGAELFTGNNMVMTYGYLESDKKNADNVFLGVGLKEVLKNWVFSYLGNLIGSIFLGTMFYIAMAYNSNVLEFISNMTTAKISIEPGTLFIKGILCNILVCTAVAISAKIESITASVLAIIMCLYVFVTCGFEHSVADMTAFTIGFIHNPSLEQLLNIIKALFPITLGNIVGGMIMGTLLYLKEKN